MVHPLDMFIGRLITLTHNQNYTYYTHCTVLDTSLLPNIPLVLVLQMESLDIYTYACFVF